MSSFRMVEVTLGLKFLCLKLKEINKITGGNKGLNHENKYLLNMTALK